MAYTFPLPLEDFFEGLPIQSFNSDLGEAMEANQTGAGEITTADLGPRLWRNDITIRVGYYADIERVKAKLNILRQANRSLLVHSMPFMYPQYDPDGSILGASVVSLDFVSPNNREVILAGLPENYELTVGDFISFTYGSNPIRYAMHQVVKGKVATALGTALIELSPFIRPGYVLGQTVRLIKPVYKAVVVPGSTKTGESSGQMTNGIQFSLVQTFR